MTVYADTLFILVMLPSKSLPLSSPIPVPRSISVFPSSLKNFVGMPSVLCSSSIPKDKELTDSMPVPKPMDFSEVHPKNARISMDFRESGKSIDSSDEQQKNA